MPHSVSPSRCRVLTYHPGLATQMERREQAVAVSYWGWQQHPVRTSSGSSTRRPCCRVRSSELTRRWRAWLPCGRLWSAPGRPASGLWSIKAGRTVPGLPTVRAHGRYGRHGDLQQFLADTLRDMAPAQLNTAHLAEKALVRFGLTMSCPAKLYYFKMNTVGRALRRLQTLGAIERLTTKHRVERALGTWRWKAPAATFAQLDQLVGVGTGGGATERPAAERPWP